MFRKGIEELPPTESPEIFGLHSNADIAFRTNQARAGAGTGPALEFGGLRSLACTAWCACKPPGAGWLPATCALRLADRLQWSADRLRRGTDTAPAQPVPCRSRTRCSSSWIHSPRAARRPAGCHGRRRWMPSVRTCCPRSQRSSRVRGVGCGRAIGRQAMTAAPGTVVLLCNNARIAQQLDSTHVQARSPRSG